MPLSTALVATDRPGRHLKQLLSHLGHKAATQVSGDGRGTVGLDAGTCVLHATPDGLSLIATAADADALAHVQDVITRHLVRFATQEDLSVDWTGPVAGEDLPSSTRWRATTCWPTAPRPTRCSRTWPPRRGRPPGTRPRCRSPTTRGRC
ncbi:DUF2218 domain-containing protein [Streptomyces sp. NPDC004296]|uniref:DUF2218 domain-containing protein n=1 Tax=Streptomyces sp. NPDC004296 TaxID=3364697 RepID=UPI003698E408